MLDADGWYQLFLDLIRGFSALIEAIKRLFDSLPF